jgi:fucose permease
MTPRHAVSAVFFANGVALASWVSHIPAVKARLAIGDGQLGLVLLSMAAGAVAALPLAGWLIGRLGARAATVGSAIGLCVTLPLPVLSPSVALLVAALTLLGACNGLLDVSMNTLAVTVEDRVGRPIMSSLHGLFSLGGVAGAVGASTAMAGRLTDAGHVLGTAASLLVLLAVALPAVPRPAVPPGPPVPVFVKPSASLLALGLLTFCGLLVEGAVGDWSAVYLHDALGATAAVSATGFGAFSLAMAAGRFGGDRVAQRLGAARLLRLSGVLAAAGLAVSLLLGHPVVAVAGFGLVGAGVANVVPILFGAAGRVAGVPSGTALAAVASTGYVGYLTGPPLIGLAAEAAGLPAALGVVAAACTLIAVGARAVVTSRARVAAEPAKIAVTRGRG